MFDFQDEKEKDEYNEHQIAWMSRDFGKIQELADSFKEKPESELFSILNDMNACRPRNIETSEAYSKFYVDGYLCNFPDAIDSAYIANMCLSGMPNQVHYNYMITSLPSAKRFAKSIKLKDDPKEVMIIKMIKQIYNVGEEDAKLYIRILTDKGQLESVIKRHKAIVTDEFLKSITKDTKELKRLRGIL